MRDVVSTLFKRSTLTFMSLVLALSSLMPLVSAGTVSAVSPNQIYSNGPFSLELACDANSKVVMNLAVDQVVPHWWGGTASYATAYGSTPWYDPHTLDAGDHDVFSVATGSAGIPSGVASTQVNGMYGFFRTYSQNFSINYTAFNCDNIAPTANVSYISNTPTTSSVTATITANEPIQDVAGWNRVNATTLEKSYAVNTVENVTIKDLAGNSSIVNVSISWIDTEKPTVVLQSPTTALFNSSTPLVLKATDNLALKQIDANVYKVGQSGVFKPVSANAGTVGGVDDYTHSINISGLTNGDYYIKFNATDLAGNKTSTTTFNFTIDNTAPTVTVKPAPDTLGNFALNIYSKVSFKFFDAKQIDKLTLNGVEKNLTNNNWSDLNGVKPGQFGAVEGENTLIVYDVAGNTTMFNFTLDTIAPVTPVHEFPSNNAFININDFWFEWTTISDAGSAISYETQYSQSPNVTNLGGPFTNVQWTGDYQNIQPADSKAHSVGANGTWYWQVRSVDAAGNKSAWTTPWKLTIDMVAPIAKILNPSDTSLVNGSVVLEGAVSDVNPMNSHFRIEGPNGYVKTDTKTNGATLHMFAWNTVGLEDGEYTIYLETRDKAQNKDGSRNNLGPSVDKIVVTVDNTNPVVTLIDYAATANVITPNITADDANLPLTYAWTAADADSAANVTISDTSALTPEFTVSVDGTYEFNLVVTDATGNSTTQLFTFTYTTPPAPEAPVVVPATTSTNTNNGGNFANVGLNEGENEDVLGESEAQDNSQSSGEESESGEILGAATEDKDNTWAPFGIVWYLWLLILAILAVLGRFMFVLVRRRLNQDEA